MIKFVCKIAKNPYIRRQNLSYCLLLSYDSLKKRENQADKVQRNSFSIFNCLSVPILALKITADHFVTHEICKSLPNGGAEMPEFLQNKRASCIK